MGVREFSLPFCTQKQETSHAGKSKLAVESRSGGNRNNGVLSPLCPFHQAPPQPPSLEVSSAHLPQATCSHSVYFIFALCPSWQGVVGGLGPESQPQVTWLYWEWTKASSSQVCHAPSSGPLGSPVHLFSAPQGTQS